MKFFDALEMIIGFIAIVIIGMALAVAVLAF